MLLGAPKSEFTKYVYLIKFFALYVRFSYKVGWVI